MDQIIFIFGIIFFLSLTIALSVLTFYVFNDDKSLGEKIGFTIGAVVSLLMIIILLIFYVKRKRVVASISNQIEASYKETETDPTKKLMTYNIQNLFCKDESRDNIQEYIDKSGIDILCTQEDDPLELEKYKSYNDCSKEGSLESVAIYLKNEYEFNQKKRIETEVPSNLKNDFIENRNSIIADIDNIKIANLHLYGGRYHDEKLLEKSEDIINYKVDLLNKVIESKPDIICGDFNSVYSPDEKRNSDFLQKQYTYFNEHVKSFVDPLTDNDKKIIKKANETPINILIKNGYKYSTPQNEAEETTNGRGKTIIDFIWYKPDKIEVSNCEIIDLEGGNKWVNNDSCKYSDHNPVTIEFSKKY